MSTPKNRKPKGEPIDFFKSPAFCRAVANSEEEGLQDQKLRDVMSREPYRGMMDNPDIDQSKQSHRRRTSQAWSRYRNNPKRRSEARVRLQDHEQRKRELREVDDGVENRGRNPKTNLSGNYDNDSAASSAQASALRTKKGDFFERQKVVHILEERRRKWMQDFHAIHMQIITLKRSGCGPDDLREYEEEKLRAKKKLKELSAQIDELDAVL